MGFVIRWHESAMELHVFPIPGFTFRSFCYTFGDFLEKTQHGHRGSHENVGLRSPALPSIIEWQPQLLPFELWPCQPWARLISSDALALLTQPVTDTGSFLRDMRVLWWVASWSDGWHAVDCSVALPELSEWSTAVWCSFCSISSLLPSFHTRLKALLPAVCSPQPSTGTSLNKPHVHIIPPWRLLLGGYVISTVMLCYLFKHC